MSTTAQNNLVKTPGALKKLSYPVSGTYAFNAGDMVYYDVSEVSLRALASGANAEFVGVAEDSSDLNVYGTSIVAPMASVIVGGIHSFKTTVSDTLVHGLAVYCGADAQTVVVADPGSGQIVGYVQMRPGQTSITGAAGVTVDVLVIPNYPVAGLA